MASRILIAEDEAIVAMDIARGLKRRGYETVGPVNTAEAAIKAVQELQPDLALIDLQLRGNGDGVEAACQIMATSDTPVVFLTAHADADTIERAKRAQPFGYLLKPFDDAELHTVLEMALDKHRLQQNAEREAAQTLEQCEERFRLLVESLPDHAVMLLDREGRIRSHNPAVARIYGYSTDALLGRSFAILHPSQAINLGRAREMLEEATRAGSSRRDEVHRRKDGGEFWTETVVTALRNREGALIGFAVLVRDTTEARRAEETLLQLNRALEARVTERTQELAAVNRELDAFTYSVAHDLRAPLRGISGYLGALQEDFAQSIPAPASNYLQRGIECANRMQALIDDLLKLSRISRQELHRIPTPLNRLVAEVVEDLRTETSTRNIAWQIGELPTLLCDPSLVRQVFANLLSNAVKYTRREAHALVDVHQETRDHQPIIVVRDNGVGFDPRHAGNLFTPFFRMHTQQEFEGTGMGLATAERIVRRHSGKMWVEAELGKGATFYFTLGNGSLPAANANSDAPSAATVE